MRILLVEDEDSIRTALTRAFERDGHEVRPVASLAEGRAALGSWSPELVVSDLKLPDGDGMELAGSLGVPFVMLSGYATYDDAVRALRLGAVDFFTKPVAIKDVRGAISRARPRPTSGQMWSWTGHAGARAAVLPLVRRLPGRLARLAVAELSQAAESGHIEAHEDDQGVRLWLDARLSDDQSDRWAWLGAHGVAITGDGHGMLARIGRESPSDFDESTEVIWPEEFVAGRPIQATAWIGLGSWFLAALRIGIGPIVGLDRKLLAACAACGIEVPEAPADLGNAGVGGGERADLFAADELGPPLA